MRLSNYHVVAGVCGLAFAAAVGQRGFETGEPLFGIVWRVAFSGLFAFFTVWFILWSIVHRTRLFVRSVRGASPRDARLPGARGTSVMPSTDGAADTTKPRGPAER